MKSINSTDSTFYYGNIFKFNKVHSIEKLYNYIIITVKPCYRVHALKLKNSISACDSTNLIGPEIKKYWKIRVTVHAELRKVLR